jgi:hypothetical protein
MLTKLIRTCLLLVATSAFVACASGSASAQTASNEASYDDLVYRGGAGVSDLVYRGGARYVLLVVQDPVTWQEALDQPWKAQQYNGPEDSGEPELTDEELDQLDRRLKNCIEIEVEARKQAVYVEKLEAQIEALKALAEIRREQNEELRRALEAERKQNASLTGSLNDSNTLVVTLSSELARKPEGSKWEKILFPLGVIVGSVVR